MRFQQMLSWQNFSLGKMFKLSKVTDGTSVWEPGYRSDTFA